jgi:gliding motility-associated-like protein
MWKLTSYWWKKALLSGSLLFYLLTIHAQFDNHWYFGRNAGVRFNSGSPNGTPQVLTDGVLVSPEACAAISDSAGNLLFYSNGVDVFNRNHQVMTNGDNLGGNNSATQMSIIPHPGDPAIFYLFTTDAFENDFTDGYRYSVIDMSQGGGLGAVTTKNVLLWNSCSERMASVRHANGLDVWLITNDNASNIFRAWLINCNGLQPLPVVSTVGEVMNSGPLLNVGVLKGSPDGKQLCQTHFPIPGVGGPTPSNFFQLFDFNNGTGAITNARKITLPATRYFHCEFSPDSKLLYLTRQLEKKLDQLEVTLPTVSDILNSRVSFDTPTEFFDLQLAVDDRIYLSQSSSWLGVIRYPNRKGTACGFDRNGLDIFPGFSQIGLPSHINDIVGNKSNGFDVTILDACTGQVRFEALTTLAPPVSYEWHFGDGNTSSLQNPVHTYMDPNQVYRVTLTVRSPTACGAITRSRQVFPSGVTRQTASFTFKDVCDSGYVRFTNQSSTLSDPAITYRWDFGDGTYSTDLHPRHTYSNGNTYTVKLRLYTGASCFDDSVTRNLSLDPITIQTLPDQTIDYGGSVQLTTTGPANAQYVWTPSTDLSDPRQQSPVARPKVTTRYYVVATNAVNCRAEDSVLVTVIPPPDVDDIYMPGAFTPNNDGRNDRIRPIVPRRYTVHEFAVYTRWGQKIFSTAQRDLGWNGRINDILQDPAVYVWTLHLTDADGKRVDRHGTFVLIR